MLSFTMVYAILLLVLGLTKHWKAFKITLGIGIVALVTGILSVLFLISTYTI